MPLSSSGIGTGWHDRTLLEEIFKGSPDMEEALKKFSCTCPDHCTTFEEILVDPPDNWENFWDSKKMRIVLRTWYCNNATTKHPSSAYLHEKVCKIIMKLLQNTRHNSKWNFHSVNIALVLLEKELKSPRDFDMAKSMVDAAVKARERPLELTELVVHHLSKRWRMNAMLTRSEGPCNDEVESFWNQLEEDMKKNFYINVYGFRFIILDAKVFPQDDNVIDENYRRLFDKLRVHSRNRYTEFVPKTKEAVDEWIYKEEENSEHSEEELISGLFVIIRSHGEEGSFEVKDVSQTSGKADIELQKVIDAFKYAYPGCPKVFCFQLCRVGNPGTANTPKLKTHHASTPCLRTPHGYICHSVMVDEKADSYSFDVALLNSINETPDDSLLSIFTSTRRKLYNEGIKLSPSTDGNTQFVRLRAISERLVGRTGCECFECTCRGCATCKGARERPIRCKNWQRVALEKPKRTPKPSHELPQRLGELSIQSSS